MQQPQRAQSTDSSRGLADPTDDRSNCGVGVVMDLDGETAHDVVADGIELLTNLEHRGTTGAEKDTGDGAGIMLQTPDGFFRSVLDTDLPEQYAVGSLFFPQDTAAREELTSIVEDTLESYDLETLTWRDVPTDNAGLGKTAVDSEPDVWQLFVSPVGDLEAEDFDRRLYVARRALENAIEDAAIDGAERFYVCSLDSKTVVYKGLLKGVQVPTYFPDLTDERVESNFVMVHERFSTNTLGAWHLAHPYRNIVHNGEFNTIQGNINWMRARETDLESEVIGDIDAVKPVINDPNQSDTASVDNALELLMQDGRDLAHALRMLVPEAWRNDATMNQGRRDWYDFHASLVEPWDGPALVAATDGERVGAVLDRNGLRPCRYDVTTDNRLIVASEAGALDPKPENIAERGRLQPGQLFLADPNEGRVIPDDEVFDDLVDDRYGEWLARNQLHLDEISPEVRSTQQPVSNLRDRQATFGYTHDELNNLIEPMAQKGKDPVGSMGDDTPLSVLTEFNRPLFTYFKQLFAQVTNPPLDYIREELVTSLESRLGHQHNLLEESPEHARQLVCDSPVLTDAQLAAIRDNDVNDIRATTIDITYEPTGEAGEDVEAAIERVRADTVDAIDAGADIVILSDRDVSADRLPIPSLLATAGVHHHLVRNGLRNHVGLVVESGDPRAVHHLATLVGYGAGAVNPYLAFQTIEDVTAGPDGADAEDAIQAYITALEDGLLKIMAKMGISTVESYQGAQIFEAVGLDSGLVAEYFEGTENRTEGIGLPEIEADVRERHAVGFDDDGEDATLERQGEYEHRSSGIYHQWNPQTVGILQQSVRANDYDRYKEFAELINDQSTNLQTLRGLLEFDSDRDPVPIEDVEPIEEIVKRFSTAAMSLGSLSPEAHENNSIAMNRIGGKSNSGEGGEPPERFGTEKECNVKQVASARFGVTSTYLSSADELQIKMAQGSKPGEGGHLPGMKVNEMIAHVRKSTPGVGLISPPPLHDIYSIEDLKQLIHDLKTANEDADINVKLVSEAGIGTIAAGVAKANADVVHISGDAGGTGASPRTSIKHAGLPWELGLAEANQMLCATGLRDRIRVSTDGGMKTGRDVAVAALLGAEEYIFGTASLVTSGCVMARQCHKNTCPVGVATQREDLRQRFPGEPENVINYMTFIAEELREIMAELGFTSVEEMIGQVDVLAQRTDVEHPKARHVDLSAVIAPLEGEVRRKIRDQDHELEEQLDRTLIEEGQDAIDEQTPVALSSEISNVDRSVGAMVSNRVTDRYGEPGLPEDTLTIDLEGTAGQSFGAFLASGISLHLTGSGNDYVGKGLSGGKLSVSKPETAAYTAEENIAIGNVALYGSTDGECYINGLAGERFAVRNSGAKAVVEGVGDHGCEYMTGGVVAVLGETGKNFAAGMSGGVAYVYDPNGDFADRTNTEMVTLYEDLDESDEAMLQRLIENHVAYTDSDRGQKLLENWERALELFVKVMPDAYHDAITEDGRDDVREMLPESAGATAEAGSTEFAASDD